MARYRVVIPRGVAPGSQFFANFNGEQVAVMCPVNAREGQTIQVEYSPRTTRSGSRTVNSSSIAPDQCRASHDAEESLKRCHGSPDPDLIFTAMDRDGSGSIDAKELQTGLSYGNTHPFDANTCTMLLRMYDKNGLGSLNREKFKELWRNIEHWQSSFKKHDVANRGKLDRGEMQFAIEDEGYRFSPEFYDNLMRTYRDLTDGMIRFNNYVRMFGELYLLTESFKKFDTDFSGEATIKYESFVKAALELHV